MLDNKSDLDTFVGNAKSCVYHGNERAIHSLLTGEFSEDDIYGRKVDVSSKGVSWRGRRFLLMEEES